MLAGALRYLESTYWHWLRTEVLPAIQAQEPELLSGVGGGLRGGIAVDVVRAWVKYFVGDAPEQDGWEKVRECAFFIACCEISGFFTKGGGFLSPFLSLPPSPPPPLTLSLSLSLSPSLSVCPSFHRAGHHSRRQRGGGANRRTRTKDRTQRAAAAAAAAMPCQRARRGPCSQSGQSVVRRLAGIAFALAAMTLAVVLSCQEMLQLLVLCCRI